MDGVRRGGYYSSYNHARDVRSGSRDGRNKNSANVGIGFRPEWC